MKKPIIVIIFIAATIISPLAKANQNCTYLVEIQTSCAPSAETTDHISLRFGDAAGSLITVKHLKNPKLVYDPSHGLKRHGSGYGGFIRCGIDMFEASGECMKQSVCSLYLKRVGSDGWRPGWVKLFKQEKEGRAMPVSYMFYFRTFVPANVWYGLNYCKP
ncbi:embryo-specific protein ATS3A-like [Carica papaya]|uniref:embryo-specific protein ATS3A-like n=1 Tax=Carica papaya TaxID=3649 RepID=UPI000B8D03C4|nr:embryo-specific protein ATS3A-like [Carica papaya]